MSRWRILIVLTLYTVPFVFLAAMGGYYLWLKGWGFIAWFPMAACWAAAYLLGWYWQRQRSFLLPPDFTPPREWTDRDREAWKLVEARAQTASEIHPDRFLEISFYVEIAQEMAMEIARAYRPGSSDPVGGLTVPEILAVIELASSDLTELVEQYVPGGHLLTIDNWRRARQATEWYQKASNIYWIISALFAPVQTGVRYAASRMGVSRSWQMLQENLLLWFFTSYIHRVGTYLIELNSGRLRVGAKRYRELFRQAREAGSTVEPSTDMVPSVPVVTITVFGQVKTGKSSFINALLGEQKAQTDVLPATSGVTRYEVHPAGVPTRLVVLDTVGYAHTGPKEDQLRVTLQSAQQSDLLLLVLHARNPARAPEREVLQALERWFIDRPSLKRPKILAVLSHIDLLTPAMEWAPPYEWQNGDRKKEQQIRAAVETVHEQLGSYVSGCVPVCTAPGKVYGVTEFFLPALAKLLDEARAVSLLRVLQAEADANKVRRVFHQLLAAGTQLARAIWEQSGK